jgi:hypothetical protein
VDNLRVGQNAGQQNNNNNAQGGCFMVKVSKPATFDGSRDSDSDVWLFQFKEYGSITRVQNDSKARLAAGYRKCKAATWGRSIVILSVVVAISQVVIMVVVDSLHHYRK